MSRFSRRAFAGLTLAACVAGCRAVENVKEALPKRNTEDGAARIDARVDATLDQMYLEYPETVQLSARASGILIMPLITEAGFGFGGGYGRGALRVDNVTEEYYSASFATMGIQMGAQQYAHALFFMTDDALANFRNLCETILATSSFIKAMKGRLLKVLLIFTIINISLNLR